jgi:uncharacterized glyoxalase superfamily protein PhnB
MFKIMDRDVSPGIPKVIADVPSNVRSGQAIRMTAQAEPTGFLRSTVFGISLEDKADVMYNLIPVLTAVRRGAVILTEPQDQPYGERQYNAQDFYGDRWDSTETIKDVAPEEWSDGAFHLE